MSELGVGAAGEGLTGAEIYRTFHNETLAMGADARFDDARRAVREVPPVPARPGSWDNLRSVEGAGRGYEAQLIQAHAANDVNVAVMERYEQETRSGSESAGPGSLGPRGDGPGRPAAGPGPAAMSGGPPVAGGGPESAVPNSGESSRRVEPPRLSPPPGPGLSAGNSVGSPRHSPPAGSREPAGNPVDPPHHRPPAGPARPAVNRVDPPRHRPPTGPGQTGPTSAEPPRRSPQPPRDLAPPGPSARPSFPPPRDTPSTEPAPTGPGRSNPAQPPHTSLPANPRQPVFEAPARPSQPPRNPAPPPAFGPGGLDGGFGPQGGGGFGPTSSRGFATAFGPADETPPPDSHGTAPNRHPDNPDRPSFLLEPEPHETFGSDAVTAPPVIGE